MGGWGLTLEDRLEKAHELSALLCRLMMEGHAVRLDLTDDSKLVCEPAPHGSLWDELKRHEWTIAGIMRCLRGEPVHNVATARQERIRTAFRYMPDWAADKIRSRYIR